MPADRRWALGKSEFLSGLCPSHPPPTPPFSYSCLLVVCFPGILFLFLVGMVLFYRVQKDDFCPKCSYIQCIPYVENFCDENFSF